MRRYNVVSRTLLILTAITFALAAPVLVQEKRQACVDVVQVPGDVITLLEKRTREQDLEWLWNEFGLRYHENVQGNLNPAMAAVHPELAPPPNAPPLNPAHVQEPEMHAPLPNPAEAQAPEGHEPPQNPVEVQVPEVHAQPPNPAEVHEPPQNPADSDRETMDLHDDAPPASPEWSTESQDFHMAPF